MSGQPVVDVLVVGLGPAGACAAVQAAKAGLSVMGVERKQQIGMPVQCAEWIPLPMGRHAQAEGVLVQRTRGMRSQLPSGLQVSSDMPGLMVDRGAFDQALASEAAASGAELLRGTRLVALDADAHVAHLRSGANVSEVTYRLLIAADGPHSLVARELGFPDLATVRTRQYTVPLLQPCVDTEVWLSDKYPGGYAWLFPKGAWANLGLGMGRGEEVDLKHPLDALHAQLVVQEKVGTDIRHYTGGAIPVSGLREHLVWKDALFVGDAAGLTHPITGAGIAAAVVSGERAGDAVVRYLLSGDRRALVEFEADIRDQFEGTLLRAVERRNWLAQQRSRRCAGDDAVQRRSWIAFPEYFAVAEEEITP